MSPAFRIAPVGIRDVSELVAIEASCFGDPWSADSFESALTVRGAIMSCARARDVTAGETILGYVVGWHVADEAQIANLAVRDSARRRGVATALLDAFITEALAHGVSEVYLEVRESNLAARALYARYGFEGVSRRREYYRSPVEDGLILRAAIDRKGREGSTGATP